MEVANTPLKKSGSRNSSTMYKSKDRTNEGAHGCVNLEAMRNKIKTQDSPYLD